MKRFGFSFGFVLGIVCTIAVAAVGRFVIWPRVGGRALGGRHRIMVPTDPRVAVGGDLRVALGGTHGEIAVFTRGAESFLYKPPSGEFCAWPVCTPDGHTVFVLVQTEEHDGHGFVYDGILRFDFAANAPLSEVQPQRILTLPQLKALFGGNRASVDAVHAVSVDGKQLVLTISSESTSDNTTTYDYNRPYWYDIDTNKLNDPSEDVSDLRSLPPSLEIHSLIAMAWK